MLCTEFGHIPRVGGICARTIEAATLACPSFLGGLTEKYVVLATRCSKYCDVTGHALSVVNSPYVMCIFSNVFSIQALKMKSFNVIKCT